MTDIGQVDSLLQSHLRDVYCKCDTLMCIYDFNTNQILHVNAATTKRVGTSATLAIEVVFSAETERYVILDGIPCKLLLLTLLKENIGVTTICAAHTKKWSQSSDLVSVADVMTDGVWEWFPEVGFEYMSERLWNILGYSQKDMPECPTTWMNLLHPDDKAMALEQFEKHVLTKAQFPYMVKARYTHKDNTQVIVLCRGTVVEWLPDGKPWRMVGTHTDVTHFVKKDSLEAKSKFISRMSHEIRSPICTILNECELLGESTKTEVIEDTCKQLIALVDDILSIDSLTFQEPQLKLKREDPSSVIAKTVKRHRIEAKKKGLKLRSTIDELPGRVTMDIQKFNQVLDNLLNNAIKYSEKGSIVVDVQYEDDTGTCCTRVIDEGKGMDRGFHTEAFEELVQGNDTMIGAGLGLTISRKLAKYMGGDVIIEKSSEGEGTTMLFTAHLPEAHDETETSEPLPPTKCRILLVDDILTNRQILRRKITSIEEQCGMRVTQVVDAVDGADAVQKFTDDKGDFQLVLMDCHMPILDGFDATVSIHDVCSELKIEAVPVVAVTASVSMDIHKKCFSAGMKFVVTKPYSEVDLIASLRSCMSSIH